MRSLTLEVVVFVTSGPLMSGTDTLQKFGMLAFSIIWSKPTRKGFPQHGPWRIHLPAIPTGTSYKKKSVVAQNSRSSTRCSASRTKKESKSQELVEKLRTGYQTESIMADVEKKGKFNRFSEASKSTVRESGNIELYDLGEKRA